MLTEQSHRKRSTFTPFPSHLQWHTFVILYKIHSKGRSCTVGRELVDGRAGSISLSSWNCNAAWGVLLSKQDASWYTRPGIELCLSPFLLEVAEDDGSSTCLCHSCRRPRWSFWLWPGLILVVVPLGEWTSEWKIFVSLPFRQPKANRTVSSTGLASSWIPEHLFLFCLFGSTFSPGYPLPPFTFQTKKFGLSA